MEPSVACDGHLGVAHAGPRAAGVSVVASVGGGSGDARGVWRDA